MKYFVKIWWEDETTADTKLMSEAELVEWFDMSDCYPSFDYEIYAVDTSVKGAPFKITYVGWQPKCLIEFVDEQGNVVASGYGTDH